MLCTPSAFWRHVAWISYPAWASEPRSTTFCLLRRASPYYSARSTHRCSISPRTALLYYCPHSSQQDSARPRLASSCLGTLPSRQLCSYFVWGCRTRAGSGSLHVVFLAAERAFLLDRLLRRHRRPGQLICFERFCIVSYGIEADTASHSKLSPPVLTYAFYFTACHVVRLTISFHQRATLGYFCSRSDLIGVSSMSAPRTNGH